MANSSTKTISPPAQRFQFLIQAVRIARPIHWVKNISIFAALIFSGNLFIEELFIKALLAFFSFSFAASSIYIFNDIFDVERDRSHPIKKNRPYAAGKITLIQALSVCVFLIVISYYIALQLNTLFILSITAYLSLQALYSLGLKNLHVVDILIIAAGFILRVYAGAFVIDAHLSVWFLLCVISIALFLASGKRRAELSVLPHAKTRRSLTKYGNELLNSYVTMFGNAAWMSWALYTFFESPTPATKVWLLLAEISRTTTISKLLMVTIPIVIFGIMRYEAVIFENRSEAPENLLLKDKALTTSIILWLGIVIWVLYGAVAPGYH